MMKVNFVFINAVAVGYVPHVLRLIAEMDKRALLMNLYTFPLAFIFGGSISRFWGQCFADGQTKKGAGEEEGG